MKIIFAINDLHSNMVKFKWLIILKLWKNKGIYIPIWLNSNEINRCLFFSLFLIYIPIWLNSNHTCGCGNSYQDSDLHSNMVKFKLLSFSCRKVVKNIYIPIWLNSNNFPINFLNFLFYIYIPIWLNSNNQIDISADVLKLFTFQYG